MFINVKVDLSHSLPLLITEDPTTPVTHIPNKKDFDVKPFNCELIMFIDPFSDEYISASYNERAEMYADSFDVWDDDYPDEPHLMFQSTDTATFVDDLPF